MVSQSMTDALKSLFEKNILSAPIIDNEGNFIGQVDLLDAVVFLVYFSKKTQELLVALGLQPEHQQINFSGLLPEDDDLKELFKVYENTGSLKNFSGVNPTKTIQSDASLEDLAELLARYHRVGVVSGDKLIDYITQSDLVKFISERLQTVELLDMNKPISALELGSSSIVTSRPFNFVVEALKLIVTKRVSSVVIVDEKGNFVNEINPHDIRGIDLETQFLDRLVMPVDKYLNLLEKTPAKTLTLDSTLKDVISVLTTEKVHRVIVLDNNKAVRVISLGDLLRFLHPLK